MITLTYPITTARREQFRPDGPLTDFMSQAFGLEKFDGGIENGFRALNFTGSEDAEEAFMSDPESRTRELKDASGFDISFFQHELSI